MRQAIMTEPRTIVLAEVSEPLPTTLAADEILLRIHRIGVCGSDIHTWHGQHPSAIYPVIQGHEYAGEVIAVGDNVTAVRPGMKATARPQLVCGTCAPCRRGQYNVCQNLRVQGFHAPGAAQDLLVVTEDRIAALPDNLDFDRGAMIEPVAVAAHATSRPRSLQGLNIVVSGAGTIGNLVAQFAMARGAKKVVVTDVSPYRLEIARKCGIDHTLDVSRNSLEESLPTLFDGEGYQIGFECAGVESSIRSLMATVEKGSDIIIVGVHTKDPALSMEQLGEHELYLIGSMMYRHEDYLQAIEAVSEGRIRLEPLITDHFPLERYAEAYRFIDQRHDRCMKVIIDL